jgi:hypothetical protein
MLELQAATRPMPVSRRSTPVAGDLFERYLVESERRVVVHCQKLLRAPDLLVEDKRRLEQLLAEAEARLQELAAIQN